MDRDMVARRSTVLQDIAQASRGVFRLSKVGNGWPAEGHIQIGTGSAPARVYVGQIGESHRGRPDERRFQNPGSNKPIEPIQGSVCLLLGVWDGAGDTGDPLVVAMDAYRRVGLVTRYSMFVPTSLLREAADTGYAEHANQHGEVIYAFRASRLADYLGKLIDVRSAGLSWSEADFGAPPASASHAGTSTPAHPDGAIHIRPKVGMYAAFARLNYKPWFAIAEFVDNAVQSYLSNRSRLGNEPLEVDLRFDEEEIVVTDRAAGIASHEFPRAFSPSHPPPDSTGLSEFGLGMKAAACWFARYWTVRTSALDDPFERLVRFDVDKITTQGLEHLPVEARPADASAHFTVITLRGLRVRPQGRTLGKIKEHLAGIYRILMEKGLLRLRVTTATTSEEILFERPPLLLAPYFRQPDGAPRLWRHGLDIQLPGGRRVWGWAGLLERASGSHAGFSVFRRDRLIQGSADETYRPLRLFRNPNSYTFQRLVGELSVDGFEVSHTKDGIQWGGYEDEVLSRIHQQLSSPDAPLLAQAEGFRVRQQARTLPQSFGAEAVQGAGAELEAAGSADLLQPLAILESVDDLPPLPEETEPAPPPEQVRQSYETTIRDGDDVFSLRLDLIQDSARPWYGYTATSGAESAQRIEAWLNVSHPFSEAYVNSDENTLGPLVRLVAALALAEHSAVLGGLKRVAAIRARVNDWLLRIGQEHGQG